MKPVIIMGVTGSVAAYRAADVARELIRSGYNVKVCLTPAAESFVTTNLFEALTGNPALTHAFDEPTRGQMAHIDWAREASLLLICPATANVIAKIAHGEADDMLTTIATATTAPIVIAPAMNPQMYASEANQENLRMLKERGVRLIEPETGDVACGEHGQGKLARTDRIVEFVTQSLLRTTLYKGKKIIITAGPTHESIDPVRYLSNRSSGKMGIALARAVQQMGAEVTLIHGPMSIAIPAFVKAISVITAREMLAEVINEAKNADLFIGCAAVSDFYIESPAQNKLSSGSVMTLQLSPTPDIIKKTTEKFPKLCTVGFAAETNDGIASALKKLQNKQLDAIVLNDISRSDIGFSSDYNEVDIYFENQPPIHIPKQSKFNVAVAILESIRPLLG